MKHTKYILFLLFTFFFFSCENKNQTEQPHFDMEKQILFVGTYTKNEGHVDGKGKGIYFLALDPNEAKIERDTLYGRNAFHSVNPSFLAPSMNSIQMMEMQEQSVHIRLIQ